jgi:heme/copper-type cytochrome/quinol oxidase subunit 3
MMSEIVYERPGLADSTHDGKALIDSSRFAFFLFLGVEIMLFAGLAGGYVILHGGASSWPPDDAPALSLFRGAIASTLLLFAALAIGFSVARPASRNLLLAGLLLSLGFGATLLIDSLLLHENGLKITGVYGGIYFLLSGIFFLHAVGGIMATVSVMRKARCARLSSNSIPHLSYYYYLLTLAWFAQAILIYA